MKHLANIITLSRAVVSVLLLLFDVRSSAFTALYIFCGISDMADGFLARKLQISSKFGAVLDSVSDAVFLIICTIKLLPVLNIPIWIIICCAVLACIKLPLMFKINSHTMANKITGCVIFVSVPFILHFEINILSAICLMFAVWAAVCDIMQKKSCSL